MKKGILYGLLGIVIGVLVAIAWNHLGTKDAITKQFAPSDEVVTEAVAIQVDNYMNPSFTDIKEFMTYVDNTVNELRTDSILKYVPREKLKSIALVCIKKYGEVNRHTLLQEFEENFSSVYQYLDVKPVQQPIQQLEPLEQTVQGPPDTIASATIVKEGQTKVQGK